MLTTVGLAFLGGGLGTAMRFVLLQQFSLIHRHYGTLTVNLLGCFIIGLFIPIMDQKQIPMPLQVFLATGLLGGLTTFSTFMADVVLLFKQGVGASLAYVMASQILGIALVGLGVFIAKRCL